MGIDCISFRQANRCDGWLAENGRGNIGLIGLARAIAKFTIGKGMALGNRNWRQINSVCDVTNGEKAWQVRL